MMMMPHYGEYLTISNTAVSTANGGMAFEHTRDSQERVVSMMCMCTSG